MLLLAGALVGVALVGGGGGVAVGEAGVVGSGFDVPPVAF